MEYFAYLSGRHVCAPLIGTAAPDFTQMQCLTTISLLFSSCRQGCCLLVCCFPLHLQFCNSHNRLFLLSQDCVRQQAPKTMGNWVQGHS